MVVTSLHTGSHKENRYSRSNSNRPITVQKLTNVKSRESRLQMQMASLPLVDRTRFDEIGQQLSGCSSSSATVRSRNFRSLYGVCSSIVSHLWVLLIPKLEPNTEPRYLLWALFFLKQYPSGNVMNVFSDSDSKTTRMWTRKIISSIAELKVVSHIAN